MKSPKCHICGRKNATGRDWREAQGGKPICRACIQIVCGPVVRVIGHMQSDPEYGLGPKRIKALDEDKE